MSNDVTGNCSILRVYDEEQILSALMSLKENLFEQSIKRDEVLKDLAHKFYVYGIVLILQVAGETKGFCAFYANDVATKTAYLSVIVIARDVQGTGCGSMLLAEMIDFCKQKGLEKLRLEVSDSNARAIRFYKAHGFSLEKHLDVSSHYIRNIGTEAGNYGK